MTTSKPESALDTIGRLAHTIGRAEVTVGNLAAVLRRLIAAVEADGVPANAAGPVITARVYLDLADQFLRDITH